MIKFFFFLNLLATISVIFIDRKKPHQALLWVLILNVFPFGGVLLYIALGSTLWIKITYKLRAAKMGSDFERVVDDMLEESQVGFTTDGLDENQKECIAFNVQFGNHHPTLRNEYDILTSGKEKYDILFQDIKEAKESIHIVYFSIHNDTVGKEFVNLLIEKAAQGVKVRLLYDALGSFFSPRALFRKLKRVGGEVKGIKSPFTHFRNHRKIVVIDGNIGYTGGMNIGDKYINKNKKKAPWRDTQIRIKGDSVYYLQYYFLYDWYFANPRFTADGETIKALFPLHDVKATAISQVLGSGIEKDNEIIKYAYLRMIGSAKKRIVLQTPYYVPSGSLHKALKIASASGVEVILMLPAQKSSFFLEPTTRYYVEELLPFGVKVYRYDGYIHAKTLTVDDNITCIGSVNIDIRSLEIDDEICVCIYDKGVTKKHLDIIDADLLNCKPLDLDVFKSRSFFKRLEEKIFAMFAPLM